MKEYVYTKTLGVIAGTLTIIGAIGFVILSLIGMSLSKALNGTHDHSSMGSSVIMILCILFLCGLITAVGSFKLKSKGWKIFYTGYCFILGTACVITLFISFGSLGTHNEIFILCMGIIYLLLSYLTNRKK
jgi:hypothetical protein